MNNTRDFSLIMIPRELEGSNDNVLLEYRQCKQYNPKHKSTKQFITILHNCNRYELEISTPKKSETMIIDGFSYENGPMLHYTKKNHISNEYDIVSGGKCKMYTKCIGQNENKMPVYRFCIEISDNEHSGLYIGYSEAVNIEDFKWAMNNY